MLTPERTVLAPGLEISRIVTGLWQVADQERAGPLDPEVASSAMLEYARAGFDTFDMADHYGSAEVIAGRFLRRVAAGEAAGAGRPVAFTKWCPTPGPMTREIVREGVERARARLGVETIDLLQFHWWTFEHPGYLDAMKELAALRERGWIRHLGVTNFDAAHLRVLVKHGVPIVSNQVSFSLLDRRAAGEMSAFCLVHGVRLLAYGTLAGGLISERWAGRPQPSAGEIADWSKSKYKRFVDAIGGWDAFQGILRALANVAARHGVSLANVAARWTLDHPAVAAVVVGARLGERDHSVDNVKAFGFGLDAQDRARRFSPLPGTSATIWKACRRSIRRFASLAGPSAGASTRGAHGNRSPATAARCACETASWSAAPPRRTARARSSARATPRGRRCLFSTKSPRA